MRQKLLEHIVQWAGGLLQNGASRHFSQETAIAHVVYLSDGCDEVQRPEEAEEKEPCPVLNSLVILVHL